MDVDNVGLRDLMGETLEFLSQSSKIIQGHYVERCHKIFIVNTPFFFNALWKIVAPMVNDNTRRKIRILGSNYSELLDCIDESQLPVRYGGRGSPLGSSAEETELFNYVTKLNMEGSDAADISDKAVFEDSSTVITPVQTGNMSSPFQNSNQFSTPPIKIQNPASLFPKSELSVSMSSSLVSSSSGVSAADHDQTRGEDDNVLSSITNSVASMFSAIKTTFTGSQSTEKQAYLGIENEYVYDPDSQRWTLSSSHEGSSPQRYQNNNVLNPLSVAISSLHPTEEIVYTVRSRTGSDDKKSNSDFMTPQIVSGAVSVLSTDEKSRSFISAVSVPSFITNRRFETLPSVYEFKYLCFFLFLFRSFLIFILEFISIWLYFDDAEGGFGYSTLNIGLLFACASCTASLGLYFTYHPRNDVNATESSRASVSMAGDMSLARRSVSRHDQRLSMGSPRRIPKYNNRQGRYQNSANWSLQSLFWICICAVLSSLALAVIILPLCFHSVPNLSSLKLFSFSFICYLVITCNIFALAIISESSVAIKRASSITSSQDMKINIGNSISGIFGSFFSAVILYVVRVKYSSNPAVLGSTVLLAGGTGLLFLSVILYISPPKYPLNFYS
jgi:hypothetical protein